MTCLGSPLTNTVSLAPPVNASATVSSESRLSRCCVSVAIARFDPSRTDPVSGRSTPVSKLTSVVLPLPFGPTMPMRSPRWMRVEKWLTIGRPVEAHADILGFDHHRARKPG